MKKLIRCVAGPGLLLVLLAGCGAPQQVDVSSPGAGDKAATVAAVGQGADETTTTVASTDVPLSQIAVVGEASAPMSGPIKMNAVVYDDSVYQGVGCTGGFVWVFDLNRAYSKLTAVAGLDDSSLANDDVTVTFKGDNDATLGESTVKLGEVSPTQVNLAGQLRLRIEVSRTGGGCIAETGYGSTLGLGNAMLTPA